MALCLLRDWFASHLDDKTTQEYGQPSILERLPESVLLLIVKALDHESIRHFLSSSPQVRRLFATHQQRLQHLVSISQRYPEYWVCEKCATLHKSNLGDLPDSPHAATCQSSRAKGIHGLLATRRESTQRRFPTFDYRHVQLALKHARIQKQTYRPYLKRLLAPIFRTECNSRYQLRYEAAPKVVTGGWNPDGSFDTRCRLVLKTQWTYRAHERPDVRSAEKTRISTDSTSLEREVDCTQICPRLMMCSPDCTTHCNTDEFNQPLRELVKYSSGQVYNIRNPYLMFSGTGRNSAYTIRYPSRCIRGACQTCLTAYSIKFYNGIWAFSPELRKIEITAFRDLGTEDSSPLAPTWEPVSARTQLGEKATSSQAHSNKPIRSLFPAWGYAIELLYECPFLPKDPWCSNTWKAFSPFSGPNINKMRLHHEKLQRFLDSEAPRRVLWSEEEVQPCSLFDLEQQEKPTVVFPWWIL